MGIGRKIVVTIMIVILAYIAISRIIDALVLVNGSTSGLVRIASYPPPVYGMIVPVIITGYAAFKSNVSTGRFAIGIICTIIIVYIAMWIGAALFNYMVGIYDVIVLYMIYIPTFLLALIPVKIFKVDEN